MEDNYIVYVKMDTTSRITAIEGGMYLPKDLTGWTQIDEGIEDSKYTHPQGNYLEKGLIDENGCYNYKLVDGVVLGRTDEEKAIDIANQPTPPKTPQEEIEELKQLVADLASLQLGV